MQGNVVDLHSGGLCFGGDAWQYFETISSLVNVVVHAHRNSPSIIEKKPCTVKIIPQNRFILI